MKIFNFLIYFFLIFNLMGCAGNKNLQPDFDSNKNEAFYQFPKGFLWGTATASYQVEGGITNDWSIDGLDAGKAAEHYQKYEEDFKTIQKLGNNSYRFSLEWSRIEPEQGKFDLNEIEHYKKVLISLNDKGIKPMVTLHHFTNPIWIAKMGGWENEQVIKHFNNYVKFVVSHLGKYVDLWITINEPNVYAFKAFDSGVWPPYKKDRNAALKVMANMLKAHAEAYHTIHSLDLTDIDGNRKNAEVGFAQHITILEPYFALNPIDQLMAYFQSKVFNLSFWEAIKSGKISINIPGVEGVNEPFNQNLKNSMDFIGINYYTRWLVNSAGEQIANNKAELTDIGWEIYPEGLMKSLKMADKYAKAINVPIYITENGLDDRQDKNRAKYIIMHTKTVWQAIRSGIPVKGYIYWTLMDNYEWADKYEPKFGLLTIDRKMRDSANVYQQISTQNAIYQSIIDQYLK